MTETMKLDDKGSHLAIIVDHDTGNKIAVGLGRPSDEPTSQRGDGVQVEYLDSAGAVEFCLTTEEAKTFYEEAPKEDLPIPELIETEDGAAPTKDDNMFTLIGQPANPNLLEELQEEFGNSGFSVGTLHPQNP